MSSHRNRDLAVTRLTKLHRTALQARSDATHVTAFLARVATLPNILETFELNHADIISRIKKQEDLDLQDQVREDVDNLHGEILEIKFKLEGNNANIENNNQSRPTSTPSANAPVTLPAISLQTYSGDIKSWPAFYELFNALIGHNESLSPLVKLQYLRRSLLEEPLRLIANLPLIASSYQLAIDILEKRYSNKRLLAFQYYNSLVQAECRPNNAQSLRQLLDCFNENMALLANLSLEVEHWNFPLLHLLLQKIDADLRHRFELTQNTNDIPDLKELLQFLENNWQALDRSNAKPLVHSTTSAPRSSNYVPPAAKKHANVPSRTSGRSSFVGAIKEGKQTPLCPICADKHSVFQCGVFKAKSPRDRFALVKEHKLCCNCLSTTHTFKACPSQRLCTTCNKKHNSLLHFEQSSGLIPPEDSKAPSAPAAETPAASVYANHCHGTALLPTAMAYVIDSKRRTCQIRVLLDTGSTVNLITESLADKLGLSRKQHAVTLHGINKMKSPLTKGMTQVTLRSRVHAQQSLSIEALVVPDLIPTFNGQDAPKLPPVFNDLELADPDPASAQPIDILIGVDAYTRLVRDGVIRAPSANLSAFSTIFGWVIVGKPSASPQTLISLCIQVADTPPLDDLVKSFWEVDNLPIEIPISPEAKMCEEHFQHTYQRLNGRFSVSLPFKVKAPSFPHSRALAATRLSSLEFKFKRNPAFELLYKDFMKDYLSQGHMSLALEPAVTSNSYFIPHHGILKGSGSTSKLRVVFDASAGKPSLNTSLHAGPPLQPNIVKILTQFRLHRVVLTCDVRQMYRQILINLPDREYHRILWRFDIKEPIQEYLLNTVTYGVTTSPFLALRVMKQLVSESGHMFPLASHAILNETYIDDVISGADSIDTALLLQSELVSLFKTAGFELHKWTSNIVQLATESSDLTFESTSFVKLLGLQWNPQKDHFTYQVNPVDDVCTKRSILSHVARLYDPCGFISPVTLIAKVMIQRLWVSGLQWDDVPPEDVQLNWKRFLQELPLLAQLTLPRFICRPDAVYELHGFSDASELGYATCLYLRASTPDGVSTYLMYSKTKVAPIKTLSIPRLELCAALLLANAMKFLFPISASYLKITRIYAWTDSMVVLTWIKSHPSKWKIFVANRVVQIQEIIPPADWHYISSIDNPADCGSRGVFPSLILQHPMWWSGPPWLANSDISDHLKIMDPITDNTEAKPVVLAVIPVEHLFDQLMQRFSSFPLLIRILSYIRRIFQPRVLLPNTLAISSAEYQSSLMCLVKHVQGNTFESEIKSLQNGSQPPTKIFRKLAVFLDDRGLLRVGGRLRHSSLPYNHRHPLLLPKTHRLSTLLIEDLHKRYLHAGGNTLINVVHQTYWILGVKVLIKQVTSKCMRCFRTRPIPMTPYMGDLPTPRIEPGKCFEHVGLDYGGPFFITLGRRRRISPSKAYLCLFVCLATKALHLELASDLTADCFLATLRRFIARRGRCSVLYSDNGTNFVGASRTISRLMSTAAAHELIEWKFHPPASPHFNGLAEAGIKSVKTNLKRVCGSQILTYEEMSTVLTQIESVLNSRPLCSLSNDPQDLDVLTPNHFLIHGVAANLPYEDLSHLTMNRLNRWQLIQRIVSDVWKRWQREYLHTLTARSKWTSTPLRQPQVGWLVLIQEPNMAPLQWPLGRITAIHPGKDNQVRVVTLKTSRGEFQRPVTKICPLPLS